MDQSLVNFIVAAIGASIICGCLAILVMAIQDRRRRKPPVTRWDQFPGTTPAEAAAYRKRLLEEVARADKWVAILPDDLDWREELVIRQQMLRDFDERQAKKGTRRVG